MFWPLWRWKQTRLLEQQSFMLEEMLEHLREIRRDARTTRRVVEEIKEGLTDKEPGPADYDPV